MESSPYKPRINKRESGVELLKIIAVFFIVVSHIVQTLSTKGFPVPYEDYYLNLSQATSSISNFILIVFRHFGQFGNSVFFVCSAWFLLDSTRFNRRKWLHLVFDVTVASAIVLVAVLLLRRGNVSRSVAFESLIPLVKGYWYITCYLLFYPIHYLLNIIISNLSKRGLLRVAAAMIVLYCGINFVTGAALYSGKLANSDKIIIWIAIYFLIAYLKKYKRSFAEDLRKNTVLLIVSTIGFVATVLMLNAAGLSIGALRSKVLYSARINNPFLICMAIALLNIFRKINFRSAFVNYISSMSLLVYVIQDHITIKSYYRPAMWHYVYSKFGYAHVIIWVFILSVVLFVFSLVCSILYDKLIRPIVHVIVDKIYALISRTYLKVESKALKTNK